MMNTDSLTHFFIAMSNGSLWTSLTVDHLRLFSKLVSL